MPLHVLLLLVVVGIAGVVTLVHLMGWSRRAAWGDDAAALTAFRTDYPEEAILTVHRADDGRGAVFELERGVGVLAGVGDGRLTRVIGPEDEAAFEDLGDRVRLRTGDFGAPVLSFRFASAEKRARIAQLISKGVSP